MNWRRWRRRVRVTLMMFGAAAMTLGSMVNAQPASAEQAAGASAPPASAQAASAGARAGVGIIASARSPASPSASLSASPSASAPPSAPATIPDLRLPRPGNYTLDRIMAVPHGAVLDSDGRARRLADYTTGKVTLLAFVYTTCSDSRGCPLAMSVMHSLKAVLEAEPRLAQQLRFVSLSFNPRYDTPAVMRSYGGAAARPDAGLRWHFLTTQSPRQLAPLLEGFGQDVSLAGGPGIGSGVGSASSSAGSRGGRDNSSASGGVKASDASNAALAHLLKLYLIDQRGVVREIYSPAFLQGDTVLADMRSLVAENGARPLPSSQRNTMR